MKKKICLILILILAISGAIGIYYFMDTEIPKNTKKFTDEYNLVDKENVFVYKNIDDITKIIESGTGIVFLGFKECPWCQYYAIYLNEIAKENNVKEIYYYDIKDIRANNSSKYRKLVELLERNLPTDDEGNKRIYVPNVSFISNGEVIYNDNETSLISDGTLPTDYWTADAISSFKTKIDNYIKNYSQVCTNCN